MQLPPSVRFLIVIFFISGFVMGMYVGKSEGIPFIAHRQEWAIGVYTGTSPLQLGPAQNKLTPVLTAQDVTDVPAEFVADPFMLKDGERWYMFFEVLNTNTKQGDIGLATSLDGLEWTYQEIVLDEDFHVSYPHVFQWQGDYYMVPESLESNEVRLYKAVDFPRTWELVSTLLSGGTYIDPTLFQHDGKWWMFVETNMFVYDTLRLYYADKLDGPWQEHPHSPIIQGDANIARPAGRVVTHGQTLIRYAQDDEPRYGTQVWAFVIEELTTSSYKERPIELPIVKGSGQGWNQEGMHHIDAHQIGPQQWLACVDGFRDQMMFEAVSLL